MLAVLGDLAKRHAHGLEQTERKRLPVAGAAPHEDSWKVVIGALWTEVCLAFPTLDMLAEGYEVYPVADAVGGISPAAHERAFDRMIQAGARPITAISFGCEIMRNWARADSDNLRELMRWYFPQHRRLHKSA